MASLLSRFRRRPAPPVRWVPLRRNRPGPRRWLAAGCLAASAAVALGVLAPDPTGGRVEVLVTTRSVPAGAGLGGGDLRSTSRPRAEVPAAAAGLTPGAVLGGVTAGALQAGEVLVPSRLVGPGLLAGRPPDDVAAPVRLADPQVAGLLRPGQLVDVLAAVEGAATARAVTRSATVLAVPGGQSGGEAGGSLLGGSADPVGGGLVVLAVGRTAAADLAQAASQGPLSVVLR